jgi:hypothetical protein
MSMKKPKVSALKIKNRCKVPLLIAGRWGFEVNDHP